MIWQRVFTACLIIPGVLAVLFLTDPLVFAAFTSVIFWVGAWEWARLCRIQFSWALGYCVIFALGQGLLYSLAAEWIDVVYGVGFCLWALLLYWTLRYRGQFPALLQNHISRAAIGLCVLWLAWFSLIQIRLHTQGTLWILCLILITSASDTAAYFVGKALGKKFFSPWISPKKTWAGFWGGLVGAFIVALLCAWQMGLTQQQYPAFMLMSVVLILLAIYGDLFESLVKRVANQKDSGSILPGHGGVLDRMDSLLPTLPFFAWYLMWI